MAPKTTLYKNRQKLTYIHNNNYIKKLHRSMVINTKLRNRVEELSTQNKELSITRNNLLLVKLSLENENSFLRNLNIQLNIMNRATSKKHELIEQTLQKCVPALVTLSQCIPSVMEDIHSMRKLDTRNKFKTTEKKERQQKTIQPMINGMNGTNQPAVLFRRLEMSPIVESPIVKSPITESSLSEETPKRLRKSLFRSPNDNLNLEPYVRSKDVAAMLKNSKSVSNKNSPNCQPNKNLGDETSWLHNQSNQNPNISSTNNQDDYPKVSNETSLSVNKKSLNEVQNNKSINSSNFSPNNTFLKNERHRPSELISPKTGILKNVTIRRQQKHKSSETMVGSDIDDSYTSNVSTTSTRSRRGTTRINYRELSLGTKLRRN